MISRGKNLAETYSAKYTDDYNEIISDNNIDVVIISVINKYIMPISIRMLENNKNVLCEKTTRNEF